MRRFLPLACAALLTACAAPHPVTIPSTPPIVAPSTLPPSQAAATAASAATAVSVATKAVKLARGACAGAEMLHTIDPALFGRHPTLASAEAVCEALAP